MARAAPMRAALAVLLVVGLAGCTVGPSERPPVAIRGESAAAPPSSVQAPPAEVLPEPQEQNATIPFFECTRDVLATLGTPLPADRDLRVECGELTVPADPDQPGLGGATLGVLRVGFADAPDTRPPLLALGDSAGEPSARNAALLATRVDPAVLERFTLVGLDRRGAGADRLDCAPSDARAALVDADGDSERQLAALLEEARSVVQECNLVLDGGLTTFRTAATAGDIDLLRASLGVERLSAIGVGDGAAALSGWATSTPTAVGRIILDGPPNPTLDDPELTESRAAAAEAAFGSFAVACTGTPGCPLGPDPRSTVTALVQALRVQPLVATDGRRLTAGATVAALLEGLREPASWPAVAAALSAAGAGDPAPLLGVLEPVEDRFDGALATACNDTQRRLAPGEVAALSERWRTAYPLFGGTMARHLLACAPWPTGVPTAPANPAADTAPPILVLGTAADPRGPSEGSRRAADSLPTARFLSWQGAGSGAYPRSACVRRVADAMLLDGVVPLGGTLCPP